jgi:hypothetical protein
VFRWRGPARPELVDQRGLALRASDRLSGQVDQRLGRTAEPHPGYERS